MGIVAAVMVVALLTLAGCGGGSSFGEPAPPRSLAEARAMVRQSVDSKMAKSGASPRQIACVDRHVEAMTARQFAHRLVEPAIVGPDGRQTPQSIAGALGKGCF
jgi:uncharacterized lipoprotein YajG